MHSFNNSGDNDIVLDGESHFAVPVLEVCIVDTPGETKNHKTVVRIEASDEFNVEPYLVWDLRTILTRMA
jgi:hypothetical protein